MNYSTYEKARKHSKEYKNKNKNVFYTQDENGNIFRHKKN